jgi:hypothetical protein
VEQAAPAFDSRCLTGLINRSLSVATKSPLIATQD